MRHLVLSLLLFVWALPITPARATVFLTTEEALKLAFPECAIERHTVYLTKHQLAQAVEMADVEIKSALVHAYVAVREGDVIGVAYFDTHVVRTQPETIMIVIDPEMKVRRIEILSFNEPQEYIPRLAWYNQFVGRRLEKTLALKRDIRHIVGATLTARATTDAVRRALALHHIVKEQIHP